VALFAGVTLSIGGLVVLALNIMRSESWLRLIVGRRSWKAIETLVAVILCLTALVLPTEFGTGIRTFSAIVSRDAQSELQQLLVQDAPPPRGRPPLHPTGHL